MHPRHLWPDTMINSKLYLSNPKNNQLTIEKKVECISNQDSLQDS